MSPRTVVEMAEFFRGFYGVIDGIITQAGGSWSVSSNDGGQHVAAPAGGAATVIIRVAGADRGFGLILAENLASVRGMRSLSYRIDDLRDEKQNDSFSSNYVGGLLAPASRARFPARVILNLTA